MHARFYSPLNGRFLSVDPKARRGALKAPQKWNRYSYGLGNPMKYVDPNGEDARIYFDNQTTGAVRESFAVATTALRVAVDFSRAGAAVRVSTRAPTWRDKIAAAFKGDTVHHVKLVNSGDAEARRVGAGGETGGPGGLLVYVATAPLDNPETGPQEREENLANIVSHEVGHELGLGHSQNEAQDLMSPILYDDSGDQDFNDADAEFLREVTNKKEKE